MVLCVRTLGLPADLLRLGPRNLVKHADVRVASLTCQWVVVQMSPNLTGRVQEIAATSVVIGACIGWFVPYLYRSTSRHVTGTEAALIAGASG
jgi:hypothetical protein